jgi:hypothetical protein
VFSQAHGFTTGQEVQVSAQTGSLPTGISASTTYYAIPVSSVILSLAANKADAVNGVASVTITSGAWTGLCTVTPSCFLQSANEMDLVFYKLVRGSLVECGFFLATQSNSYVLNQCMGNTVGVTFTVSGSVINYTADNSDVTTTISMNYLVIKL